MDSSASGPSSKPSGPQTEEKKVTSEEMNTAQSVFKKRDGDQELPIKNDHPAIQDLVIADMESRREVGIKRYGTALQPFNGRDALRDAYEEAMDLCMYLRQLMYEEEAKKIFYDGVPSERNEDVLELIAAYEHLTTESTKPHHLVRKDAVEAYSERVAIMVERCGIKWVDGKPRWKEEK